jgi:hypothetical protein
VRRTGRHFIQQPDTGRHYYQRPGWQCTTCGDPWPCANRRAAFLEKYAGQGMRLRGIMGALMLDAERDLLLTREEAHERFAAWTLAPDEHR